jgi:hypothetical protein
MPDDDIEVEFTFEGLVIFATVDPGDPGVHTYANGDPGYPPSGTIVDVRSLTVESLNSMWDYAADSFDELFRESLLHGWPLTDETELTNAQCRLLASWWWEKVEEKALEEAGIETL